MPNIGCMISINSPVTARGIAHEQGFTEEDIPPDEVQSYVSIGNGKFLKISVTEQALNNEQFWEYSYREESSEIAVFVNTESDLWSWGKDSRDAAKVASLISSWAIVDSLYFCLVNDIGIEPSRAVAFRDEWHTKLYAGEEK